MGIVRLKPCYLTERKRAEQAFKQKHDAEKVNELLSMFNLPLVSTKGYQTTPRTELIGASSYSQPEINPSSQFAIYQAKAIRELLERTSIR